MKKIAILGMGITGSSVASFFTKHKIPFFGIDKRIQKDLLCDVIKEEEVDFEKIEKIIVSPGIPPTHPIIVNAKKLQIPTLTEMDLAFERLQGIDCKILAITGSNGKTTTTLFVEHLLKIAGFKAVAAGNIGNPLLSEIDKEIDIFVLELSSFQLQALQPLELFDGAVILNITANHLDWHANFDEYVQAKFKINECLKKNAPFFVSSNVAKYLENYNCAKKGQIFNSLQEKVASILSLSYREGDLGLYSHDFENVLAAFALTQNLSISNENFCEAFQTFRKPPHRMEKVIQINGVTYINDSKATTIAAVAKAVEAIPGRVILIAGGVDKGGNFEEWIEFFKEKVIKLFAIGSTAARIKKELGSKIEVEIVEKLENGVRKAHLIAKPGDTVLLSPGGSSYDQFENYEQRGNVFKQLVYNLEKGNG